MYEAEVDLDPSLQLQRRDQKLEKKSGSNERNNKKPPYFYTMDTIMDLIDRIKRL
jgi:hypothetical protein